MFWRNSQSSRIFLFEKHDGVYRMLTIILRVIIGIQKVMDGSLQEKVFIITANKVD
jgi:hypothetical protein